MIVIAVILIGALVLYITDIGCSWKYFFGINCPGCGMTRAYIELLKGNVSEAFRYNFMFPSVPLLFLYILFDGKLFGKRLVDIVILSAIAAGFLLNWILKLEVIV